MRACAGASGKPLTIASAASQRVHNLCAYSHGLALGVNLSGSGTLGPQLPRGNVPVKRVGRCEEPHIVGRTPSGVSVVDRNGTQEERQSD